MSYDGIDGFYIAYITGVEGNGIVMIVMTNGMIVGADPLGVVLDGEYKISSDRTHYDARLAVKAPAGGKLLQGVHTGPDGISYEMQAALPLNLEAQDYLELGTPLGKLNVRFKKLRSIGNA